jgi:hypothetical protein
MNNCKKNYRIIPFDIGLIFDFLRMQTRPVSEVEILKHLLNLRFLSDSGEELYSLHFSLYHALYRLRRHECCARRYLHLDLLRLRMIDIPKEGFCVLYFPNEGRFCERAAFGKRYCRYHENHGAMVANSLLFDPMEDFYLNPENIRFGESELLARLQRGAILYSIRRGEVEEALNFFGLFNPSRKTLQKRYHEFAKKYHPDFVRGDDSMMKRINSYYQVLREIFLI